MSIYYNPDDLGLEVVAEDDWGDPYEFDIRVVWLHRESNTLYTARDSGCSCPSPFEDYNTLADLMVMNAQVVEEVKGEFGVNSSEWVKLDEAWRAVKREARKRNKALKEV